MGSRELLNRMSRQMLQFNGRTKAELRQDCPWLPAPSCDRNFNYRMLDGTCNNLDVNVNFGRAGTPFRRLLFPLYRPGMRLCVFDPPDSTVIGDII